jgi:hypothetical protein
LPENKAPELEYWEDSIRNSNPTGNSAANITTSVETEFIKGAKIPPSIIGGMKHIVNRANK